MLFIFLSGAASGFPWVVFGAAATLWLQSEGFSRTTIGLFGSIAVVYAFNFVWAPLLDTVKLPLLRRLGQRRSWLLLSQILMFIFIVSAAFAMPSGNLFWFGLFMFGVAVLSATQDVGIDAYRIDILKEDEQNKLPITSALYTSGWHVGFGGLGGAVLFLSNTWAWQTVYFMMSGFMLVFVIVTLLMPRTDSHKAVLDEVKAKLGKQVGHHIDGLSARCSVWFFSTVVEPFKDFFTRYGWVALNLFLFVFLFKIGEAFLGRMSLVFYKEIGFTTAEIATYSKWVGTGFTILFSIIASIINVHYGLIKGLFIGGIAMASTNLMFAYIALVGPNTTLFFWAIVLDNFTAAFSTVAFVAFISHLTNRVYSATQYALMASVGNFGRTTLAGGSGWLVDYLAGNWALFFIITALMVLPSLLVLRLALPKIRVILNMHKAGG